MRTITPAEALMGNSYAIVSTNITYQTGEASGKHVYGLYPDEDTARRIAADLCKRYGEGAYFAARIEGV